MNNMIFFDTETSGLIENESLAVERQPRILEIGAIKVDSQLEVIERFSAILLPPGYEITPEIEKITGLTQKALVAAGKQFPEIVPRLCNFFLGSEALVAHNLRFDLMMLVYELRRIGWEYRFPFPRQHIDTLAMWPGKLADWGASNGLAKQEHRAMADAQLLLDCYRIRIGEEEAAWTR